MKCAQFKSISIFLLMTTAAYCHWTAPVTIDYNTNAATEVRIAKDDAGNAMAVFVQSDGTNNIIYAIEYDSLTGWGTAQAISAAGADASMPRIACLGTQQYLAIFKRTDGSYDRIYSRLYNGSSWETETTINDATNYNSTFPEISGDANGHAMAVWRQSDGTDERIFARRYISGSWDGSANIVSNGANTTNTSTSHHPRVAYTSIGVSFVTFSQHNTVDGHDRIYANKWNGSSWGTAQEIDGNTSSNVGNASVAIEPGGNALFVFKENNALYSVYYNGTSYETPVLAKTAGSGMMDPTQICHLGGNNYLAVYQMNDGSDYRIYASRTSNNGTSWDAEVFIDQGTYAGGDPRLSADSTSGKAAVVFTQYESMKDRTYYNFYNGTGWDGASCIDNGNYAGASPDIALYPDSDVLVVFIQDNGTTDRMWSTMSYKHKVWDNGGGDSNWSTATNWTPDVLPATTDTVRFDGMISPTDCALGSNVTIEKIITANSPGGFDFSSYTLTITGDADFAGFSSITTGTGALELSGAATQALTGPVSGSLPEITHSGSGTVSVEINDFTCASLTVNGGGTFDNSTNARTVTVNGNCSLAGSTIDATGGGIEIGGDLSIDGTSAFQAPSANMYLGGALTNSGGTFTANNGTVNFNGTGVTKNIDPTGLYNIYLSASSSAYTLTAPLAANTITIDNGTLDLGTSLTHSCAGVSTMSSAGTLDFNTSTLQVTGNVDFTSLGTITRGTGILDFTGGGAQTFTPLSGQLHPSLVISGGGTVTLSTSCEADGITISSGTLDISTFTLTVTDGNNLDISGGMLNAYDGIIVDSGDVLIGASGTLTAPQTGMFEVQGSFSIASGGVLNPGDGTVTFTATTSGNTISSSSNNFDNVVFDGSGGDWTFSDAFGADSLTLTTGTLNLGTAHTHTLGKFTGNGGTLDFSSSTLNINNTDGDFSGLSSLTPGTGAIDFSSTGTQIFTPLLSVTHPEIIHSGTGTLQLATNDLYAEKMTNSGGTLNFNTKNISTTSGDFTVTSGSPSTFSGHDGITLTVAGNASFTGQSGNLLNMDPATTWYINATGTLDADYASIGNCDATGGTQGIGTENCTDMGGNINWAIGDILPPDNDMTLIATAVDTGKVMVSWNPSAIDSADADSVGIWYKTGDYPDSANDVTALGWLINEKIDSVDTITGLNNHTVYYFGLAVRDYDGNWSDTALSACDTAYTKKFPVRWTGAVDSNWSTAGNWSTNTVPTYGDSVVFDNGSVNCILTSGDSFDDLVFTSGYTGTFDFNGNMLSIEGRVADFRSGGTFTGSGSINLYAMDPRHMTFYPKGGVQLPTISFEKGSLTVAEEPLWTEGLDCMMLERLTFTNLDT
ncbi:MAG: hypothetical protein GF350_05720, partial [Chitinivibrionales bacterium]|nr:hypothetical protein [Chitinivibrionales bacterium]